MIHDTEFDALLVDSVSIDMDNLQDEYQRISADMAYWTHKNAIAQAEYVAAKAALKREQGLTYDRAVKSLTADYEGGHLAKPPTLPLISARADTDEAVADASERLANATRYRVETEGTVQAVDMKKSMLLSIGADQRKERDSEPYIRD